MSSPLAQFAIVFSAAALASLVTWAVVWFSLRRQLERDVSREIDRRMDQLGRLIRDRVRQGIVDGVAEVQPEEVVQATQKGLLKNAAEWVDQGVNRLLGRKRRTEGSGEPD
jgi:hypothetical protein